MDHTFDQPEDFAADESFIHYCFRTDESDILFWEQWLNAHPEKKETAEEGRALVFLLGIRLTGEEKQQEFQKLNLSIPWAEEEDERPRGNRKLRLVPYGAFALLCVLAGSILWKTSSRQKTAAGPGTAEVQTEYAVPSGEMRTLVLQDGSRIIVNAASKISLDTGFGKTNRSITLSGEAYFTVSAQPDNPFIIHTGHMEITVLGTTLNVKDYPEDQQAEAALISGSVAVKLLNSSSGRIILKPDEKIVAYKNAASLPPVASNRKVRPDTVKGVPSFDISPMEADPLLDSGSVVTAWTADKLVFRDESFEDLARRMARKYNMQFHFSTEALRQYRFTGIFYQETVKEALQALQLTSPSDPFYFSIAGKDIYITKNQSGPHN